jgi:hypothetical protein
MALDANDRYQIVRLSSDFSILGYQPRSVGVERLFLSTLGAWLDLLGDFDPPLGLPLDIIQWRHRGTMGRDHYVKVVHAGHMVPGGHRAAYLEVTERKFQVNPFGQTTAYLRQRLFVVVRQPVVSYEVLGSDQQRAFPFRTLRITTLVTPNLDPPADEKGFFPTVGGKPVLFHLIGEDAEKQAAEFMTPLLFVSIAGNHPAAVSLWNASSQKTRDLAGQNVAFARASKAGDTTFPTSKLTVSAVGRWPAEPPFFPKMDEAVVSVPAWATGATLGK